MKKFYLTTPLYYPNARLHAGHAYTTLVCDALARYKRLCGYDVAFLTGTDEHGEKLERAAVQAGMTPPAFVAEKREQIKRLWKLLDIDYTHFIFTDRKDHTTSVQRMLSRAQEKGYIYKGKYEGRYCIHDERYLSESAEPVNCDICGRPGELISEENYFFRLSAFQDQLLKLYEEHPAFVQPDFRRNEVRSFVKSGLRDISVSRKRIKWGIPWPNDPEQVFYVWYDALTGYLTGIGFAEGESGSEEFHKYWPADVQMIGKDIVRFHAIYWPAFLLAADTPLPTTILTHGWLKVGEEKMSKSKGNAVYVEPVVELFRSETNGVVWGSDVLRYYVLRDIPFGLDGSISYEGLIQRYNSDLANDLGNLASRTITMLNRYFDGRLLSAGELNFNPDVIDDLKGRFHKEVLVPYRERFDAHDFSRALETVWQRVGRVNKYLVDSQPWIKAEKDFRTQKPEIARILHIAAEDLRLSAVLLYPVLPRSAELLWKQLGCEGYLGKIERQQLDQLKWGDIKSGSKVGKAEPIFPRLDKSKAVDKLIELESVELTADRPAKVAQVEASSEQKAAASTDQKITIEDFAKVDMRVGEVKSAERVEGAQKLLKLMVDIGGEVRQVVAGIAGYYEPENLIGTKIILVANLQPRKLRGVESNGMVLAATVGPEGRPVLVTVREDAPSGSKLK